MKIFRAARKDQKKKDIPFEIFPKTSIIIGTTLWADFTVRMHNHARKTAPDS